LLTESYIQSWLSSALIGCLDKFNSRHSILTNNSLKCAKFMHCCVWIMFICKECNKTRCYLHVIFWWISVLVYALCFCYRSKFIFPWYLTLGIVYFTIIMLTMLANKSLYYNRIKSRHYKMDFSWSNERKYVQENILSITNYH